MRTTVDIEAPLLKRLRSEARRRGVSFKALLSGIIRRALDASSGGTRRAPSARCRLPTFSMGTTGSLDIDKALRLAGVLEDEETARELSLRK